MGTSTDAVTGLLVPPADAAGLAAALRRLAQDPALRTTLGAAARQHVVTHLDRRVCTRQTAALFEVPAPLSPQRA